MLSETDFLKIKELISESKEMDTESKSELLERLNKSNISGYGLNFVRSVEEVEKETYPFNKNKFIFVGENTEKEIFKGEEYTNNFLFEGDNLESLKVLRETHKNRIDVIYIDPPYNTGNKDFVYNDSFVSNDDGFRHSKWLSFMEKRLRLARELMTDDGVIFISIDDNEYAQLKLLCDQIFGDVNRLSTFIWNTKTGAKGIPPRTMFTKTHEYVLAYSKKEGFRFQGLPRSTDGFSNPDKDPRGLWKRQYLQRFGQGFSKKTIVDPKTGEKYAFETPYTEDNMRIMVEEGRIIFPKDTSKYPARKEFYLEYANEGTPITSDLGLYSQKVASEKIKDLFGTKVFDYPKPVDLIKLLVQQHPNKNATVLDFFAGSGTTGHAVLELNNEDGGNRNFILCTNNENNICEEVTYQRLSKVINGYTTPTGNVVDGIPANLNYVKVEHIDTNEIYDFSEVDVIPYIELKEGVRYNCVDSFEYCESKNKYVFLVSTDSDMLSVEEFLESSDEKEVVIYCNNISVRNKYVNTPYYLLFKSINEKDILSISKS